MKIHYDRELDSLYISLSDGATVEAEEVSAGIVLDFDSNNRVVGIEIDHASTLVDLEQFETDTLPQKKLSA